MTLLEIMAALGCSKATASRLRAGTYPAQTGPLIEAYRALTGESPEPKAKVKPNPDAQRTRRQVLEQICRECPRESCAGCRIAEL